MLLVLRRGHADTISRRNLRRQLAFLLYRLLRWRLPGRNRLRELFETLPASLRAMRGAATVGCKSKDLLTLVVDVRAYLHGCALSTIALDGSGSRSGLLPDIGALGTALFRDACAAETHSRGQADCRRSAQSLQRVVACQHAAAGGT